MNTAEHTVGSQYTFVERINEKFSADMRNGDFIAGFDFSSLYFFFLLGKLTISN
jgi:hypothetical protein